MRRWGSDTDRGSLKLWEGNLPQCTMSIKKHAWIDVDSNAGFRFQKHINTLCGEKTQFLMLEQVVYMLTILR